MNCKTDWKPIDGLFASDIERIERNANSLFTDPNLRYRGNWKFSNVKTNKIISSNIKMENSDYKINLPKVPGDKDHYVEIKVPANKRFRITQPCIVAYNKGGGTTFWYQWIPHEASFPLNGWIRFYGSINEEVIQWV